MEKQRYAFFPRSHPGDLLLWSPGVLLSTGFGHSGCGYPTHGRTSFPVTPQDCCGSKLEGNYSYQQMKVSSKIWSGLRTYKRFLSSSLSIGKCWPSLQKANTVTSTTLLTSLSNCICKHPPLWVAERVCFIRSYPSKVSIATCVDFFFLEQEKCKALLSGPEWRSPRASKGFESVVCDASYEKVKKKKSRCIFWTWRWSQCHDYYAG